MKELSTSSWQRQGSTILFDPEALSLLLRAGCLISLRQFLTWEQQWPPIPPGNGQTVLVAGLEAYLELLPPEKTEYFLRFKIRRLIEDFQYEWQRCGLVFGFTRPASVFKVLSTNEEMVYMLTGGKHIRLAHGLWNGGAAMDIAQLVKYDGSNKTVIGYHVRRLS